MEKYNTYRLLNGKRPASWQLPLTEVLIEKIKDNKSEGLKSIKYVPGVSSFFAEDIKGEAKPKQIWFNKGEFSVLKIDELTNNLLKAHPWFNKHYELYSEAEVSKKELSNLRIKDRARKLIDESDSGKINAIALALFGQAAFAWDDDTCELKLRKFADKKPEKLQKELDSKDYESKYVAALALSKGIMRTNPTKTQVVWNDGTEGMVIRLAKGESAIHKLGEFLNDRTDESEMVLQEIGARIDKIETKVIEIPNEVKAELSKKDEALSEKDKEIEALRAQLAAANEPKEETTLTVDELVSIDDLTIQEARAMYVKKFNVAQVPNNKKNNIVWIKNQLKQ